MSTSPQYAARMRSASLSVFLALALSACAGLPPGNNYPKSASYAGDSARPSALSAQVALTTAQHPGLSGMRIVTVGVDGFLTRAQIIDSAERTLDLQYYIFREDETGRLLSAALLRAADRGVRVRLLVDDGDTKRGDERVLMLGAHAGIEVRVFNPFAYRGHRTVLRLAEFIVRHARLDHRMHNKLLVVDNTIAMVGGRNVGNQYFQMDPESQFADDDVFVVGPVVAGLASSFDEFWNSRLAIPAAALVTTSSTSERVARDAHPLVPLEADGVDYGLALASGEPYAGMLSGRLPLVWAQATVLSDSPDKYQTRSGVSTAVMPEIMSAAASVDQELMVVSPYFIPRDEEMQLIAALRARQVRVRVLTNSLESAPELLAHAGYGQHRVELLKLGVELHEVRTHLSYTHGSGQTDSLARYGTYALHAKLYVFDRKRLFIGSMNFDQRSKHLNTEVGLMIESPALASQTAERFEAMSEPQNSYVLALQSHQGDNARQLTWQTREDGNVVDYWREPTRRGWHRLLTKLLSWLPIEGEL